MSNILFKAVIPLLIIIFPACDVTINSTDSTGKDSLTEYGSGNLITQQRTAGECTGINIKYAANIILTQDTIQTIKVEADDNIIDDVVTEKQNDILVCGLRKKNYSNVTINIYVSLKLIKELTIEGAGNISVHYPVNCTAIECAITGAGNITLTGKADSMSCKVAGAGNIEAFDFKVKNCSAILTGTGYLNIFVSQSLYASIIGIGNITYDGNPSSVTTSITGMGNITKR